VKSQVIDKNDEIIEMLRSESILQRRHIDLLEAQHSALLAGDEARFAEVYHVYEQFLCELEKQAEWRRRMAPEEGASLRAEMKSWSVDKRKKGSVLLDSIAASLEKVARLAEQNTVMLNNQLNYIQFMMSIIVRASRGSQSYAPKGMMAPSFTENLFVNHMA